MNFIKELLCRWNLQMMINNKMKIIFSSLIFFLASCSFDNKTGIWKGLEQEKRRALELQRLQDRELVTIYSSESKVLEEFKAIKNVSLSIPKTNSSWLMPDLNEQNFKGNLFLFWYPLPSHSRTVSHLHRIFHYQSYYSGYLQKTSLFLNFLYRLKFL